MTSDINFPLVLSLLFAGVYLLVLVWGWMKEAHQASESSKKEEMFSAMVDWRSYEKPAYARRNRKV